MTQKTCLNCSQESEAHYCPRCGQSKAVKVSSLWYFINEILEVIYDLDSKVWKSILPLIFKPGKLTNEYIAGRRVNYLPPFRIYLILSILFFLVAAIPDFTGFNELSPEDAQELAQNLEDSGLAINEIIQEEIGQISLNLPDEEIVNDAGNPDASSVLTPPTASPEAAVPLEPYVEIDLPDSFANLTEASDCVNVPWDNFLGERMGARALNSCQTAFSDNGVSLMQSFIDNLPIMMFFCVPLLAVFMKFLYLFKKRKYVEHLMFLFHTHSFIFFLTILTIAIVKLDGTFLALGNAIAPLITAIWIYAAVYVFLALKRVYRQGLFMTSVKMLMLFPGYSICLAITFVTGLFITFITI